MLGDVGMDGECFRLKKRPDMAGESVWSWHP